MATAVKMIAGIAINKAVALYIGPSGLALVGQFQSFSQLAITAAQGAINNGVTKYTAEYGINDRRIPILFSTAIKISLVSSVSVGGTVVLLSSYASEYFLKSENYSYIFIIFGFTIVFFVINSLLLSIINGLRDIRTWVTINIIQSIYSIIFTTLLIVSLGFDGVLIALVTNQSIIFVIVLWMLRKHQVIKIKNFNSSFDIAHCKKLAPFALMAITSAAIVPISHLIIRTNIGETISWSSAGYWQAIWHISTIYLTVVTTTLSIYYLPRLSEIAEKVELRREILNGYKIILPIIIATSFIIFLLKDFLILMLFTDEFAPMSELFLWQLVGNVMKISSFLFGYLVVAKAMTKTYISTELIFSISFVLLSELFVERYGLVGMSYSYAVNYGLHLVVMICVTKSKWTGD